MNVKINFGNKITIDIEKSDHVVDIATKSKQLTIYDYIDEDLATKARPFVTKLEYLFISKLLAKDLKQIETRVDGTSQVVKVCEYYDGTIVEFYIPMPGCIGWINIDGEYVMTVLANEQPYTVYLERLTTIQKRRI